MPIPSPETLREILEYKPETGELFWKKRPEHLCASAKRCMAWNRSNAGKPAFTTKRRGYMKGDVFGHSFLAHRVIWAMCHGNWPSAQVDHINGDRSDNRLSNLREASGAENCKNRKSATGSSSKYLGVYWDSRDKVWRAKIRTKSGPMHLGSFPCEVQAAKAYDEAAGASHGEFARLNF